ncbi:hypothetical protein L218DRAFT_959037 [Marasmius fiardii PR-910]|nr:hypothetical protein L218DRAFT_959037 [Marasmius fiardii PR-910]
MDSLTKLPKLNKTQFISSFVATQKSNAKTYAEEGRMVTLTWQHGSDSNSTPNYSKSENSRPKFANPGFATPILKPRKQPRTEVKAIEQPLASGSGADSAHPRKSSQSVHRKKQKRQDISDDDDKLARLAERRTRKRAKREILRPQSHEASKSHEPDIKARKSRSEGRRRGKCAVDGTPALALMHGFSASNVGKNRLTLKMDAKNLGVFNRGKASSKVNVPLTKNKRVGKNIGLAFSEDRFLNKAIASMSSLKPKSSSRVSTPSECTESETHSTTSSQAQSHQTKGQVVNDATFSNDDIVPRHTSKLDTKPAESEVWNIEIEGFELPSAVSDSRSTKDQKINTCQSTWNRQIQLDELDNRGELSSSPPLVKPNGGLRRSSSTIAPSQCRVLRKTQSLITSKYFQLPSGYGKNLVQEAPQLQQPAAGEHQPLRVCPVDPAHSHFNNCDREEIECGSAVEMIYYSNVLPGSPARPNTAPSEFALTSPVDQHLDLSRSGRLATPHFPDTNLSYPGHSVQEWACSPGLANYEENLHDKNALVDDYCPLNHWDDIEGPEVRTVFDNQSVTYDIYGHPFHGNNWEGIEDEMQPELWPENGAEEGLSWKDYSGLEAEDDTMEGWYGEVEDGDNSTFEHSSNGLSSSCDYQPGFYEGKELLLGISSQRTEMGFSTMGLTAAEVDVVMNMKTHWWPQKL